MEVGVFSTQRSGRVPLVKANAGRHQLTFLETRLTPATAELGAQFEAVCIFVNDALSPAALQRLRAGKARLIQNISSFERGDGPICSVTG